MPTTTYPSPVAYMLALRTARNHGEMVNDGELSSTFKMDGLTFTFNHVAETVTYK